MIILDFGIATRMRDGTKSGVFGDWAVFRFLDLWNDVLLRWSSGESLTLALARASSEVSRSAMGKGAGDTGRRQTAHATVTSAGFVELAGQESALGGEGI